MEELSALGDTGLQSSRWALWDVKHRWEVRRRMPEHSPILACMPTPRRLVFRSAWPYLRASFMFGPVNKDAEVLAGTRD